MPAQMAIERRIQPGETQEENQHCKGRRHANNGAPVYAAQKQECRHDSVTVELRNESPQIHVYLSGVRSIIIGKNAGQRRPNSADNISEVSKKFRITKISR